MQKQFQEEITAAVSAVKAQQPISHFYFVACGGSLAFMQPAEFIFTKELTTPATILPAREFVTREPKALDEHSVVVSCSHSGTTPETVEATKYAAKHGALTIAFTNAEQSPLAEAAAQVIHYNWGKGTDASDLNTGVLYGWLFETLNALQPADKYVRGRQAIETFEPVVAKARVQYTPIMQQWAKELKREKLIYAIGSGVNTGEVYSFSACWLQEMQWINSGFIHSGEFFHGPFEVTDFDVPFVICKGIGKSRVMDERAATFAKRFSKKVYEVDGADFDMSGVDEDLQEYYSQIISGIAFGALAEALAYERGHSLDVRRYMWHLDY
ncbi:SIS domain-containing protein [Lacticaseibacillus paracasei]|uniref:SIS domain-containing protein n=1 Tax=Lacticaseibacillus paracasei TaxID=1597 RepID=UPI001F50BCDA|nr:SIS domain-containing protein [Lacticaseibacillus paracasei]MCI0375897.1 SIS domain-containing protein [Lacticaseibacillus paracasei]MCI0375960.1 SIS domain-containing protein [Lacticaseibacillus paracasei]